MKYINTLTRNIIETECTVEGENWVPLGDKVPAKEVEKKVEAPKTEEVKETPKTEEAPKKTVAKKTTTNTIKPRKTR